MAIQLFIILVIWHRFVIPILPHLRQTGKHVYPSWFFVGYLYLMSGLFTPIGKVCPSGGKYD